MIDREKAINDLNTSKLILCNPQMLTSEMCVRIGQAIDSAIGLLKEQETIEGCWIPVKSPTGVEVFGVKEMTVQNVHCSVCNAEEDVSFSVYKFCPRCGAKMERAVKRE